MDWNKEELHGSASELHNSAPPKQLVPTVRKNVIPTDAIVLGSSQKSDLINIERQLNDGIELANRRTGGGVVFIDHRSDLWLDVFLPSSHSLSTSNLDESFDWLGRCWLNALTFVTQESDIWQSSEKPASPSSQPGALCFSSMGYGEVGLGEAKIVGISQRKTREWSKFQCLVAPSGGLSKLTNYLSKPLGELPTTEPVFTKALDIKELETQILLELAELEA